MRYSLSKSRRLFDESIEARLELLFSRRQLSHGQRLICSVACLQAVGDSRNLLSMLDLAVSSASDYKVVYEVLLQGYLFCGYPRAIESFFCLDEVMAKKKFAAPAISRKRLVSPAMLRKRGMETAQRVYGDKFSKIHNKISALCPDLGYLMVMEGYGHTLSRTDLDIRPRELAVVSSLSAIGADRQLNSHLRGAVNVGCTPEDAAEAILSGAPWLAAGAVERSLRLWQRIFGMKFPDGTEEVLAISV